MKKTVAAVLVLFVLLCTGMGAATAATDNGYIYENSLEGFNGAILSFNTLDFSDSNSTSIDISWNSNPNNYALYLARVTLYNDGQNICYWDYSGTANSISQSNIPEGCASSYNPGHTMFTVAVYSQDGADNYPNGDIAFYPPGYMGQKYVGAYPFAGNAGAPIIVVDPTPTSTPTASPTDTPSSSPTATETATPTPTPSPTDTATAPPVPESEQWCIQDASGQICGDALVGTDNSSSSICIHLMSGGGTSCGVPSCLVSSGKTIDSVYCSTVTASKCVIGTDFDFFACFKEMFLPDPVKFKAEYAKMGTDFMGSMDGRFPFGFFTMINSFFTKATDSLALGADNELKGTLHSLCYQVGWTGVTGTEHDGNIQNCSWNPDFDFHLLEPNSLGDRLLKLMRPIVTTVLTATIWVGLGINMINSIAGSPHMPDAETGLRRTQRAKGPMD